MKVERVSLREQDQVEGESSKRCDWCESIYNKESESYDKPERTEGYRIGYSTVCKECLTSVWDAKTLLDKATRVKSVEV